MQERIFKKTRKTVKPEVSNSLEKPKARRKVQLSFHLDQCLCDEKGVPTEDQKEVAKASLFLSQQEMDHALDFIKELLVGSPAQVPK